MLLKNGNLKTYSKIDIIKKLYAFGGTFTPYLE